MEKEITISFNWYSNDNRDAEIKKNHQEALEESAMERIGAMMKEGYVEGELHDNVRMDDEDGEDGVSYQGWWSVKKK